MLLSIARVVRCDESEVTVQQVRRPGMGAVSFGGHVEEEEEIARKASRNKVMEWMEAVEAKDTSHKI